MNKENKEANILDQSIHRVTIIALKLAALYILFTRGVVVIHSLIVMLVQDERMGLSLIVAKVVMLAAIIYLLWFQSVRLAMIIIPVADEHRVTAAVDSISLERLAFTVVGGIFAIKGLSALVEAMVVRLA